MGLAKDQGLRLNVLSRWADRLLECRLVIHGPGVIDVNWSRWGASISSAIAASLNFEDVAEESAHRGGCNEQVFGEAFHDSDPFRW